MVGVLTTVQNVKGEFSMFNHSIRFDKINNMDSFINGIDAASLENEFKNWKINFKDKDNDFKLGYKMGKRQYQLQRKDNTKMF